MKALLLLIKGIRFAYLTSGIHYDYHTGRDQAWKINYDGMVSIVKYSELFIERAEKKGRIRYRKIPGLHQFSATWSIIFRELDYLLTVGFSGLD